MCVFYCQSVRRDYGGQEMIGNKIRNEMKTSNNGNEAERMWKSGQIHSNVMKRNNYLMILY